MSDERLKIAVFIDFDNIEIGVKNSLGGHFDVGAVLEAVKERGEVVSKVAYGDWTRATDYGRTMSQHAIHMVQRNLTPGGDKNGADINLALDALEMAFTHGHINAFVVVGGDSDFITLVEKLKQYDRKVFVVGGRSFTSQVMQKNCTEFIAYEDILGITGRSRHAGGRTRASIDMAAAMPLVRRAIKLLADREMTPQLGLLKSTLLQLDSSFSERAYGASSFRDFVEKLAKAGHVLLKGTDRSIYVELREAGEAAAAPVESGAHRGPREAQEGRGRGHGGDGRHEPPPTSGAGSSGEAAADAPTPAPPATAAGSGEDAARLTPADGLRLMVRAFSHAGANPRFPMYVRQFKQFMRAFDESFDERRYGFAGLLDALRFGQREGLFRLDRDRQGGVRLHPGAQYLTLTQPPGAAPSAEVAAADAAPPGTLPLLDVEAATTQESPLGEDQPAAAPTETELTPEVPPIADAAPAPPIEGVPTEEAVSLAEPAAARRRAPRKRTTTPRTGTRAKKAAPPAEGAKKRPARPRAKKS